MCITEKIYHINTDLRHSPTEFMTSMLIHPSLSPYRIKHSSDPVALERQGTYECLHTVNQLLINFRKPRETPFKELNGDSPIVQFQWHCL